MAFADAVNRMQSSALDRFGVDATHSAGTLRVLLDREYVESGGVAGYQPVARTTDTELVAAGIARDAELVIDGTAYRVREMHPDTHGWTDLILEAQ
jgi:hypothetical protein